MVTLVLASLAMIGPFTIDTIFPGFPQLGREFEADSAALQQITSVYLVSFAVMSVLHGPISDAVGRKPVMLVGLIGFVLCTVACALAPTLSSLLVARALQGVFAGAATIVSRAVVRDMFSGAEAQRLMARVMLIFGIAPAIAPVIGGEILRFGDWPWIFWFVAVYGVAVAVLMVTVLPETLPRADRQPLRVRSVLGGLWQVARSWPFERLALCTTFTFASYFIYIAGAPIIVVELFGLGEQDFWMLFVPMIGGMMTGSLLVNRIAGTISTERLLDRVFTGLVVAAVLGVGLVLISPDPPLAVVAPALTGLALGIGFPVLQIAMLDLFPHHRGAAASMASFLTLCFNALLAGVIMPLVGGSIITVALASAFFAVLGGLMWVWHRRSEGTRVPVESLD